MSNVSSSNGLEKYPKLRFKGFSEPWERLKLSDFAHRVTRKNSDNQTDIPLTISSKDGLINQNDFFSKQVASKDMSGYYLLQNGEYAYNKSYSVGFDFGSIKRLEKYAQGALSTLYICFALDRFDSDFIKHYFDSLKWYREIYMISAEGARNHGLLNVPTEDFFATLHTLPTDEEEQKKIAQFLDILNDRIEKQQALVENLKKYKRGLLRKIFDKKSPWHNDSDWHKVKLKEIGFIQTGTTPETSISEYYGGTYLWVTPSDISSKEITNTSKKLTEKGFDKGRKIPANSILVTCIASIGKNTILRTVGSCNQQINSLTPSEDFNLDFLYYAFCYNEPLMHEMAGTGGMEILNKQAFSELEFSLPSLALQERYGTLLSDFEKKIDNATNILERLCICKKGLLQKMFI